MSARVVVVGGGFGGAFSADYLRRALPTDVKVELIDEKNYFVFQPLLPEVASGTINAPDAVTPLRLMLPGVRIRMAEVFEIDFDARHIRVVQGTKRVPQTITYEHLVLAPGLEPSLDRMPGFSDHCLTMRNLADAFRLRNHLINCLEHADITPDPGLKSRLLTFVVAGGGFSGVEIMGECVEMVRQALRFYPNVSMEEFHPVLVQRDDRLLPELSEKLGEYARRQLEKRGVEVRLNTGVRAATSTALELDDGTRVPAATIVTTVGNGPRSLARQPGITLERGRIPVDRCLRVPGLRNVWSLGDAALVPLGPGIDGQPVQYAPPTAQYAMREARCLAGNVAATFKGKELKAFRHKPKGALASMGHYQGVGDVFGIRVSGLLAWMIWRFFYIGILPGFTTRLRVALDWLFDYFLPRNLVQLVTEQKSATRFIRVAEGDVLFGPGQIVDGFYTVVEGSLESRVADEQIGEDFVRVLGPGDHWGERAINGAFETHGTLIALEDSRVMVVQREDFANLRACLPVLDDYFKRIPQESYPHGLRDKD